MSSDYQLHIFSKKNTYSRNPKGSKEGPRSNLNQWLGNIGGFPSNVVIILGLIRTQGSEAKGPQKAARDGVNAFGVFPDFFIAFSCTVFCHWQRLVKTVAKSLIRCELALYIRKIMENKKNKPVFFGQNSDEASASVCILKKGQFLLKHQL